MQITEFQDLDWLQQLLEMQRLMSQASSEADLIHTFVNHSEVLRGAHCLISLNVESLSQGEFRLIEQVEILPRGISLHEIHERMESGVDVATLPVLTSPVISPMIKGHCPVLVKDLDASADPSLLQSMPHIMDCLSVPIFAGGEVCQWVLLFRDCGDELDQLQLRIAVSELNVLARAIDQLRMNEELASLHRQLSTQLSEIGQAQRSILPAAPPDIEHVRIAVHYEPAGAAGGDYYDFRQFGENLLGCVIADVAGHGPGAAVTMAMLRTALAVFRLEERPAFTVVRDINRILLDGLRNGTFVTAVFVAMDYETGVTHYANAGHLPPCIRRANGEVEVVEHGSSPPLGLLEDLQAAGGRFVMAPGDTLFLYTDGATEAMNKAREMFGMKGLRDALSGGDDDPEQLVQAVLFALREHVGSAVLDDDLCMVAVRYEGNPDSVTRSR